MPVKPLLRLLVPLHFFINGTGNKAVKAFVSGFCMGLNEPFFALWYPYFYLVIIEGLHRQFRKVTKTKAVFPNNDSLRRMLYLASNNIVKKWTQRYREWDTVLNHLALLFEDRQAV